MTSRTALKIFPRNLDNWHYYIPVFIFFLAVISQYSGLDVWLSTLFYDSKQNVWTFQSHWITKILIHEGGRYIYFSNQILMYTVLILSFIIPAIRQYRRHITYFTLATLSGTIFIVLLKNYTHIYAPWDLEMYGGIRPLIHIFDSAPPNLPVGRAFPAGHASAGYAFMSLYFVLRELKPAYRWHGLGVGLALGLIYGISQQARGAHFVSHDMFTVGISWSTSLILYLAIYNHRYRLKKAISSI